MNRTEKWVIAAVFTSLIAIPTVVFAIGARPTPNQNRPPTPLPELTAAGFLDRELTPQLDAYLQDALIIAPGAVAAEAWADVALGDNPSDEVTLGSNGWLYYTFSLNRPCLSADDVARFSDTVQRAERVVAATGRELIVAIAPDKATIVPEFLPDSDTCVDEVADALHALDRPRALLTVWDEMRTARASERSIYFRLDTHWTHEGAAVMAEALVDRLQPGGWSEAALEHVATTDHEGDLTVLLGLPSTEPNDELEVILPASDQTRQVRKLRTAAGNEYDEVVAVDFATTGDPVVSATTLVMHDSFGWQLTPMLAPYFQSATFVAETDPRAAHMDGDLEQAETVIHLSAQRSLHEYVLDRDLAAGFASAYADHFDALETGVRETGERLELEPPDAADGDIYVIVTMADGTEGAEVAYNDVTAVLTPDSPRSAFYLGEGGTMFFAGKVEYRLVSIDQ